MDVSTPDNLVPFGAAVLAIAGLVVANRARVARWNARGVKDLPGPQSLKDATAAKATPVQMTLVGSGGCIVGLILLAVAPHSAVETRWSPSPATAVAVAVLCIELITGVTLLFVKRARRKRSDAHVHVPELRWSAVALLVAAATGALALVACVVAVGFVGRGSG